MKFHHLRNATFVIESGQNFILVDPMLSEKGKLPPFAYLRHKARRNPVVPLPETASVLLDRVTLCLITHCQKLGIELLTHTDHLDSAGRSFLRTNSIPVVCLDRDAPYIRKNGIEVQSSLTYWTPTEMLGGQITAVPALHGHSWVHSLMANGAGYFLQLPGEPTLYISGDTVYTDNTDRALNEFKPDVAVVAAGSAELDVGGPILMTMDEIIKFIRNAPDRVIANHLEALNHCPTTRSRLKQELEKRDLLSKTFIPEDGESITLENR